MLRRAGTAAAAALALIAAVLVVGRGRAGGARELLDSNGILAAAESEARGAKALARGAAAPKAGLAAQPESRAQELRQEVKDMAEMKNIRTYSGGGSKILAEAQKEEKTLKALASLSQASVQQQPQLKSAEAHAALKAAPPKETEHALAREEELADCEPFCSTHALSQSRKAAHNELLKKQARQRMQQRAKLSKAKAEEAAEERAHCLFCKPAATSRLRAERGPGDLLDTRNLLKISGLKDSDLDAKTGKLQMPSLHRAQRAASHTDMLVSRPKKMDKAQEKIDAAADQIATLMSSGNHDSSDVDREMAKIRTTGTSWKALWGSGLKHSDLSGADRSRFEYLAGRPVNRMESNLDDPLSAKTAANPFGNNFHY